MTTTAYDLLAVHPFLDGLSDRQVELLSLWSKRSLFHAGNRVFHQGARADRFWLIRERATPVSAREGRYPARRADPALMTRPPTQRIERPMSWASLGTVANDA